MASTNGLSRFSSHGTSLMRTPPTRLTSVRSPPTQVRYLATSRPSRASTLLAVVQKEARVDRKRGDRPKTAQGTPMAARASV